MLEIKIDRFFTPSLEITDRIIKRLSQKRLNRFQSLTIPESYRENDYEESDELKKAFFGSLEDSSGNEENSKADQRWLKEIVYHFLGRLAHRLRDAENKDYNLTECITKGMSARLGLKDRSDSALLTELAQEFGKWLCDCQERAFVAGWGKLSLSRDGSLRIHSLRDIPSKAFARTVAGSTPLNVSRRPALLAARASDRDG